MDSKEVSLPLFDEHLMMPCNKLRIGDCCGRMEAISDGYYCQSCDFFVHKICGESSEFIEHPCHSMHTLKLVRNPGQFHYCDICGNRIKVKLCYRCEICNFNVHLYCAKPPEVIDISETHQHKLTLRKENIEFVCDAKCGNKCGNISYGFPYECNYSQVSFHVDCVWDSKVKQPSEVSHFSHSLHPLKLFKSPPPDYSDGRCSLCGREIRDKLFYHCSSCNFSLDMRCLFNPPPQFLLDLKSHDHQLTLLPRLNSFRCNGCGLEGDRSPYICAQCGFMIHQACLNLPSVIYINRHNHRVSRTSVIGVVNCVCGVCLKKMDWTSGGYSCQTCLDYFVHSKCATRNDVLKYRKEFEGVPEEIEDPDSYVVIDENTIQHFSHEHNLRFHINGVLFEEENKRCSACTHPVGLKPFFGCIDCDFFLHESCANFPRRIWHVLSNEQQLTLVTSTANIFVCYACRRMSNGFRYQHAEITLDVLCGSFPGPFIHPSHPHRPLFYTPQDKKRRCNGCNDLASHVLTCSEDGCEFFLDFKCATLPFVVKHSLDDDYPFSLCYGKRASGRNWCEICEKESNVETWFYTCKDQEDTLHTNCVFGDFSGLMPTSTIEVLSRSFEVMLNNGISRPFCRWCKSYCMYPIMFKMLGTLHTYICSLDCLFNMRDPINDVDEELSSP